MPKFVSDQQQDVLTKSRAIWTELRQSLSNQDAAADPVATQRHLFETLVDIYGSRCFMTELINAALETNTEYFVAPYLATPQIIYLYQQKKVHACIGSVMAMSFYLKPAPDDPEPVESAVELEEIITDFDLDNGTFTFVGKADILQKIPMKTTTPVDWLAEVFLAYGGYYGIQCSEASKTPISEAIEHLKK